MKAFRLEKGTGVVNSRVHHAKGSLESTLGAISSRPNALTIGYLGCYPQSSMPKAA